MSDYSLDVLEQDVRVLIEDVVKEQGFQDPHYHVTPGSKKGDNYLGVVHRIKVSDRKSGVKISLIVKCQPSSLSRRDLFRTSAYFAQEAQFYNSVLPVLHSFQQELGFEKSCPPTPKCYHAGDVLILEDMCPYGYIMLDRQKPLDFEQCKILLDSLAKYHAVSFALCDQQPEEFANLIANIHEAFLVDEDTPSIHTVKKLFNTSIRNAIDKFIERYPSDNMAKYVKALEKLEKGFHKQLMDLVNGRTNEPYSVISHGDCWINNILFKNEDGEKPAELCFIDFQLMRYASPVIDISYAIYSSTDKSLRDKYYDTLITSYHNTLCSYLKELGSDPEKLFPLSVFQDQLKRYSRFGMFISTFLIPLFTCNADETVDLDAACEDVNEGFHEKFNITHSNDVICFDRISDVLLFMVDRGYLE